MVPVLARHACYSCTVACRTDTMSTQGILAWKDAQYFVRAHKWHSEVDASKAIVEIIGHTLSSNWWLSTFILLEFSLLYSF